MGNFLSKERQDAIAKKLDDVVVLNGIAERLDGVVFRFVVGLIDKYTPKQHWDVVESIINEFMDDGNQEHDGGTQPHRHE